MKPTLAFIGLGTLGTVVAERLLDTGFPLVVYNRTPNKTEALVARGATRASSPREAAAQSELVLSMVSDCAALEDIALSPEGVLAGLPAGGIHADMSTVSQRTTRQLEAHYRAAGRTFVHAPVLGSKIQARTGTLRIFVGGAPAARQRCRPVFEALGEQRWEWDEAERATAMKLGVNLILGSMMVALVEGLVFACAAGLEPATLLEVLRGSALDAHMYQRKGGTILERDFAPSFFLRHMRKDFELMLEAGAELGVPLPTIAAARELYVAAQARGYGEQDYSAVVRYLEELAGIEVRERASGKA